MAIDQFKRQRRQLQNQVARGRLIFLAVIVVTLINQVMLWVGSDYHFLFSAAMPYYLNWLARQLSSGGFKVIVTIVTLALYGAYGFCFLQFLRREWLMAAVGLYIIDTVLLVIFALTLLANPLSCLLEVVIHAVVAVILVATYKARLRLAALPRP